MSIMIDTYISLLADVGRSTRLSEIRGSCYNGDLQWVLKEAPKLEKLVLHGIERGDINPAIDAAPAWLRRLVAQSFVDGYKLRALRQLLLFCYKASIPHDKDETDSAFKAFLECNDATREYGGSLANASPSLLRRARQHCQSVLWAMDVRKRFRPSHGPGAVTTYKERWSEWFETIESVFPYSDYLALAQSQDQMSEWPGSVTDAHITANLIAVPKDSRGPRLICVHPAEAIWVQQAVRRELERAIALPRSSTGPWPKGHVHFEDQSVNGRIALLSSKSRRYATIDMKEASDRISEPLVQALFGQRYRWFGCCRAQKFVITHPCSFRGQGGDIACYAPMGNATTFPVQSLVFWAICVSSMQHHGFHQPGAVFVFGDDIIIPTECAEVVCNDLESFGLLVNRDKSFWRGAFRESCGVDAFDGVDTAPLRWKTTEDAEHLDGLLALSDLGQRLRVAGYEEAASCVYSNVRKRLGFHGQKLFLTNNLDHGGLAEFVTRASEAWRDAYWQTDTQWFCSPVWRIQESRNKMFRDCHWNGVLESVCSLERTGHSSVPDRGLSRALRLKRGWTHVT